MYRCVLFVFLIISAQAFAEPGRNYTVRGGGTRSCGQWTSDHQKAGVSGLSLDSWLMGYLTGANAFLLTKSSDVTAGTDLDGLVGWMNNYCKSNPLETIESAANALIVALMKRSGAF